MAESEILRLKRSWHDDLREQQQQRRLKEDGVVSIKVDPRAGERAEGDANDIEEEDLEDVLASAEHVMNNLFEE